MRRLKAQQQSLVKQGTTLGRVQAAQCRLARRRHIGYAKRRQRANTITAR
jgi:hypothetical protein